MFHRTKIQCVFTPSHAATRDPTKFAYTRQEARCTRSRRGLTRQHVDGTAWNLLLDSKEKVSRLVFLSSRRYSWFCLLSDTFSGHLLLFFSLDKRLGSTFVTSGNSLHKPESIPRSRRPLAVRIQLVGPQ